MATTMDAIGTPAAMLAGKMRRRDDQKAKRQAMIARGRMNTAGNRTSLGARRPNETLMRRQSSVGPRYGSMAGGRRPGEMVGRGGLREARQPMGGGYGPGGRPMAGPSTEQRQAAASGLAAQGMDPRAALMAASGRTMGGAAGSVGAASGGFSPMSGYAGAGPRPGMGSMGTGMGPGTGWGNQAPGGGYQPPQGGSQWNYGGGYAPSAQAPQGPQMPGMPSYQTQQFGNSAMPYLNQARAETQMYTAMPSPMRQRMQFGNAMNTLGMNPNSLPGYGNNWGPDVRSGGNPWARSWLSGGPQEGSPAYNAQQQAQQQQMAQQMGPQFQQMQQAGAVHNAPGGGVRLGSGFMGGQVYRRPQQGMPQGVMGQLGNYMGQMFF